MQCIYLPTVYLPTHYTARVEESRLAHIWPVECLHTRLPGDAPMSCHCWGFSCLLDHSLSHLVIHTSVPPPGEVGLGKWAHYVLILGYCVCVCVRACVLVCVCVREYFHVYTCHLEECDMLIVKNTHTLVAGKYFMAKQFRPSDKGLEIILSRHSYCELLHPSNALYCCVKECCFLCSSLL